MHISEGVLSGPVLLGGAALTAAGTAVGLRKLNYDRVPQVAVLSSSFFVASLVHVPIGPSSVHLIMNGLVGLLLGWVAFPAIVVGLILQALLFQFGGFTTLGVNGLLMALPAVACFSVFGAGVKSDRKIVVVLCSFLCGFGAVFLGCLVLATALALSGEQFLPVSKLIVAAHIPVMVIEGLITTLCIQFVKRVRPEILEVDYGP